MHPLIPVSHLPWLVEVEEELDCTTAGKTDNKTRENDESIMD